MTVPSRWLGCPAADAAWRRWDDELLVYAEFSGSVHVLSPAAGDVFLDLMASGTAGISVPMATPTVAQGNTSTLGEDQDDAAALLTLLQGLASIGLAVESQ